MLQTAPVNWLQHSMEMEKQAIGKGEVCKKNVVPTMCGDVDDSPRLLRFPAVSRSSPPAQRIWLPFVFAGIIAKLAGVISRRTGRSGTTLPGRVLLALNPPALARLARRSQAREMILVSATNGKTTVSAMLATILARDGRDVAHNMTGANLRSGIATSLLLASRPIDVALLETDEATLPRVAPDLGPSIIVLGNLFRDQLDRYGELDVLADRWADTLRALDPTCVTVVYNADDPLISHLVDEWARAAAAASGTGEAHAALARTVAFGMTATDVAADGLPHAVDSVFCRRCGAPLAYAHSWVGHLGDWACTACDNRRPVLDVACTQVELDGLAASNVTIDLDAGLRSGGSVSQGDAAPGTASRAHVRDPFTVRMRIPGLYNTYNALAAAAAASVTGTSAEVIEHGLDEVSPAFGRFERIPIPGSGTLTLLLVKNPTGLNEVVRTLVAARVDLTATLFALNDGIADGRDTSWIWDADVEPLLEASPSGIIATGDRAAEFALRCVYGGADVATITVDEDLEHALFELLERAKSFTTHGHAYALVTYTSMLAMREIVTRHGWADAYWARRDGHAREAITSGGSAR